MLTESMRVLAGLQETVTVENLLPKLIKEEQQQILREEQRIKDEKKTVVSHFDTFKENMERYQQMIEVVNEMFSEEKTQEFVAGLFGGKYTRLQRFADIVINESFGRAMQHLDQNYYIIKEEVDKINFLMEAVNETDAPSYFVSNALISKDEHDIRFNVFKNKDLTEKVSSEIEYGTQILSITESVSMIKVNGKKYYTTLTNTQLKTLENKGFLI